MNTTMDRKVCHRTFTSLNLSMMAIITNCHATVNFFQECTYFIIIIIENLRFLLSLPVSTIAYNGCGQILLNISHLIHIRMNLCRLGFDFSFNH